jgi:hypothetical protein
MTNSLDVAGSRLLCCCQGGVRRLVKQAKGEMTALSVLCMHEWMRTTAWLGHELERVQTTLAACHSAILVPCQVFLDFENRPSHVRRLR